MGKATSDVQIPGAPAASPGAAAPDTAAAGTPPAPGPDATAEVDPRDAEIAALRAQLAAKNAPPGEQLIFEADGPNVRRHKAESKHLHLTTAELDKQVRSGKVKLAEHHVLCKDGWYVNPEADKRDRQG
jgi:hypothetical protein